MRENQKYYPQIYAYHSRYYSHIMEYDWILFFDFDEYLYIENKTLDDYVKSNMFEYCSSIAFLKILYR